MMVASVKGSCFFLTIWTTLGSLSRVQMAMLAESVRSRKTNHQEWYMWVMPRVIIRLSAPGAFSGPNSPTIMDMFFMGSS